MQDALKTFIAVVTSQAIERHLLAPLPELLSPMTIAGLTEEEVRKFAAEKHAIVLRREELEERINMLKDGRLVFQKAAVGDI